MTDVTLVMPYYENPGMLAEHWRLLQALPDALKPWVRVVIVDDGSPNNPARPPEFPLDVLYEIYRIKVDVRWNQDAARNIGVKHAPTDWVLLTDMDHIVPRRTWRRLIEGEWDLKKCYSFARVSAVPRVRSAEIDARSAQAALEDDAETHEPDKPHPNSWFVHKHLFNRVGGYDERFAGLYGTDGDFKVRLLEKASEWVKLPEYLIRVGREVIPDASTTSYGRKEPHDRPEVQRLLKARPKSNNPRPVRFRFPYERVA